jgi:hypothetical protein
MLTSHFVEVRGKVRNMDTKTSIPITIRYIVALLFM